VEKSLTELKPNEIGTRLFDAGLDIVGAEEQPEGVPPDFSRMMAAGTLGAWTNLLTRPPTLTDEEREDIATAVSDLEDIYDYTKRTHGFRSLRILRTLTTLRNLLTRTKGA
jgi:aryl carrier-like protein